MADNEKTPIFDTAAFKKDVSFQGMKAILSVIGRILLLLIPLAWVVGVIVFVGGTGVFFIMAVAGHPLWLFCLVMSSVCAVQSAILIRLPHWIPPLKNLLYKVSLL